MNWEKIVRFIDPSPLWDLRSEQLMEVSQRCVEYSDSLAKKCIQLARRVNSERVQDDLLQLARILDLHTGESLLADQTMERNLYISALREDIHVYHVCLKRYNKIAKKLGKSEETDKFPDY